MPIPSTPPPLRLTRTEAMELLDIKTDRVFAKIVARNPQIVHRIPGETHFRYLRVKLLELLQPAAPSRKTRGAGE